MTHDTDLEKAARQALEALEDYENGQETIDYLVKVEKSAAALRRALEQPDHIEQHLEMVDAYCKAWEQSFLADNPHHTVRMTAADRKHIEAGLKVALSAQPAQQLSCYCPNCEVLSKALAEIEAAQQEPVAWRNAALRVGEDLCSVGPFGYYDMTAEQWLDWALSVVTVHEPPRPQAPEVKPHGEPLTDEQIDVVTQKWAGLVEVPKARLVMCREFARAIEAAHGIKGKK